MINKEVLNNNINLLNLDKILIKRLNDINIFKIEDLCDCNRDYLKAIY